ncbi:MAG: GSU2403 family nucleotidyltransferase fold protein [bacterium]
MMKTVVIEERLFPPILKDLFKGLSDAGFFESGILAGSWVFPLYKPLFGINYTLSTLDVDLVVQTGVPQSSSKADVERIITDLGFLPVTEQSGWRKYTREGLTVEFLTNRKGNRDGVDLIENLNISAIRLPFLDLLFISPVMVELSRFKMRVPCPEAMFVQKLVVSQRRVDKDKVSKDLEQCRVLIPILDDSKLAEVMNSRKWSKDVLSKLEISCRKIGFSFENLIAR